MIFILGQIHMDLFTLLLVVLDIFLNLSENLLILDVIILHLLKSKQALVLQGIDGVIIDRVDLIFLI